MSASPATRREPFRTRAAGRALQGVRIRVAEPRHTTVLVFLHEGLGSVGQWRDFPDVLCARLGMDGLAWDRWFASACERVDALEGSELDQPVPGQPAPLRLASPAAQQVSLPLPLAGGDYTVSAWPH